MKLGFGGYITVEFSLRSVDVSKIVGVRIDVSRLWVSGRSAPEQDCKGAWAPHRTSSL